MALEEISLLPNHQGFVNRFVAACESDDRIVAAFLGGSNAKGYADQHSDIDVSVITNDVSFEEFLKGRESFLRSLGELIFFEDFGIPNIAFFIFEDGTEGELYFGSQSHLELIHSGPFRILLDKRNILADAAFPEQAADPDRQTEELRRNVDWFWHELSHFITAMARGKLWWARGQLEALRAKCVNLARLKNDFSDDGIGEEPYFKIEYAMDVETLAPLIATFCPMEKNAMLGSARLIIQFFKEIAPSLCEAHGLSYPQSLEKVMLERFEKLSKT